MGKDNVYVDVALIPEYIRDNIARETLAFIRRIKSTPEGRAAFLKKRAELGF